MSEHPIDSILIPLGLEAIKTGKTRRTYQMKVKDRWIQVHYQRIYHRGGNRTGIPVYRWSSLHIYVDAPKLKTRAKIGKSNVVMKGIDKQNPVTLEDPAYEGWNAFSLAPEWVGDLMRDPDAKALILRLTEGDPEVGTNPAVFIQPGALVLIGNVYESKLTTDYVRQRIDDLVALADAAEGLPASYQPVRASQSELALKEGQSVTPAGVVSLLAILAGMILLVGMCFGLVLVFGIFG